MRIKNFQTKFAQKIGNSSDHPKTKQKLQLEIGSFWSRTNHSSVDVQELELSKCSFSPLYLHWPKVWQCRQNSLDYDEKIVIKKQFEKKSKKYQKIHNRQKNLKKLKNSL